jgi:peptidyl-tRNA hydrolase
VTTAQQFIKCMIRADVGFSEDKIAESCIKAALGLNKLKAEEWQWDSFYLEPSLPVVVLRVSYADFQATICKMAQTKDSLYIVEDSGDAEISAGTQTVLAFLENNQ